MAKKTKIQIQKNKQVLETYEETFNSVYKPNGWHKVKQKEKK